MYVDLAFNLAPQGIIPADHGYALYGALSRIMPALHQRNEVSIHPIWGRQVESRQMMLLPWSKLTLRVPDDQIATMLALSGKSISLAEATVHIGVPEILRLQPVSTLRSRLVVIKVRDVPAKELNVDIFHAATRRQLDELGVSPKVQIHLPSQRSGTLKGQPIRRTLQNSMLLLHG